MLLPTDGFLRPFQQPAADGWLRTFAPAGGGLPAISDVGMLTTSALLASGESFNDSGSITAVAALASDETLATSGVLTTAAILTAVGGHRTPGQGPIARTTSPAAVVSPAISSVRRTGITAVAPVHPPPFGSA